MDHDEIRPAANNYSSTIRKAKCIGSSCSGRSQRFCLAQSCLDEQLKFSMQTETVNGRSETSAVSPRNQLGTSLPKRADGCQL